MRDELEDVIELYAGMPPDGQQHWRERSLPSIQFESGAERDEFLDELRSNDKQPAESQAETRHSVPTDTPMARSFKVGQRVKVYMAGLIVGSVQFSQNVEFVHATIEAQVSDDPPIYRAKLLISFRGVDEVEVPIERIRPI